MLGLLSIVGCFECFILFPVFLPFLFYFLEIVVHFLIYRSFLFRVGSPDFRLLLPAKIENLCQIIN